AERDRGTLAQRAGGRLDARQRDAIGMTLERAAELAQRDGLALGEVARARHDGVERGHRVALREHDAVAVRPVGLPRIVAQSAENDRRQDVDDRQRAARVAGAGVGQHPDDLHAARAGDRVQVPLSHHARFSMKSAIASMRTPETATSGAYTTWSAAHTIVPLASRPTPTTLLRKVLMLSLMRTVFGLSGATIRPLRMI